MFAGLTNLRTPDMVTVQGMVSREGEEVPFTETVVVSEDPTIYVWLGKIEN
jgi:hypothetical protein